MIRAAGKLAFQVAWRYRELTERIALSTPGIPIVIYTMGKVGSTSIYYALRKKLGGKVLFTHRMLSETCRRVER